MPEIGQQVAILVIDPVRGALPIIRVDLHGGIAKEAGIERLVQLLVVEDLTRLFSNDSVFLDPCVKEAIDPLDA